MTITKARIADATIAYAAAQDRYNSAMSVYAATGELDAAYHEMHDAHEELISLVARWNIYLSVKDRESRWTR